MFSENRDWEQTNLIICLPCSVTFNGSHCIPNKPCKHYLDIHSSAQLWSPFSFSIQGPTHHLCINFMLGLNWSIFHSTVLILRLSPVSPFPPNLLDKNPAHASSSFPGNSSLKSPGIAHLEANIPSYLHVALDHGALNWRLLRYMSLLSQ